MNLLQQFVDFLLKQKPRRSLLTVKNYKADIGQFVSWFEKEFKLAFNPSTITLQIIEQYKKSRNLPAGRQGLSPSSIERHLSSLRKFFNFLQIEKIILQNPFEKKTVSAETLAQKDPWMIRNFKSFLYDNKKSNLTIKNYINDIRSFFAWFTEVALTKYAWNLSDRNLVSRISFVVIEEYKQRMTDAKLSPRTINRKLSSLRNYIAWAKSQKLIPENHQEVRSSEGQTIRSASWQTESPSFPSVPNYSPLPPVRLTQKLINVANYIFDSLFILPIVRTLENTQYLFWKTSGKKVFKKNVIFRKDDITNIKREFYAPLSISTRYLPKHKRIWHFIRHARPKWYKIYHSYSFSHYFHFAILIVTSCMLGFGLYSNFFAGIQKSSVLGTSTTAPSRILSFQGRLTDSSDNPITTSSNITFSIYSDKTASTGAFLWQEVNLVKPDLDGTFSVILGKNTPINDSVFGQNQELFLGIKVGSSPELTPRQQLATVPFASNSETLQGLEPITNTTKTSNVVLALDSSGNLAIADSKPHTFQTIGGQFILSGSVLTLTTIAGSNSNVEIAPNGIGKIDFMKPIQNSSNNNNVSAAAGAVEFDDNVAILATTSAQSALYINQNSIGPIISASTSGIAKFAVDSDGTGFYAGDLKVNGGDLTSTATTFNLLNSTVTTLNIGGTATSLVLGASSGTVTIRNETANIQGHVTLGDAATDKLTFTGRVAQDSDIVPIGTTGTNDLGATALPWDNIYTNNLYASSNLGVGTQSPGAKLDVVGGQTQIEVSTQYSQRLCHSGSDGTTTQSVLLGDCSSGGADMAEYYGSEDKTIEAGDLVVAAHGAVDAGPDSKAYVRKSSSSYQGGIIGIVSTNPYDSFGKNYASNEYSFPVALIGRIPVKISLENGPIKAGDLLTSSSIPGVAMKATQTGPIVGKSLEDINSVDESKIVGYYDPENKEYRSKANFPPNIPIKPGIIPIVKIYAFANVSWYDPGAYIAQNGDLIIGNSGSNGYSVANSKNEMLSNIGGFLSVIAANIKAGLINAEEIVTKSLVVTADSLIVNGQNLKDYIANVVLDSGFVKSETISPVINTNQISANIISPLSSDSVIVKLSSPSGSLIVQNASGSPVANIDSTGKINANEISVNQASISGNLNAGDASISGTLRAGNIVADSYFNIASYSAQLANVEGLIASYGQFNQGLMVFGSTSLSDISVAGNLSIGGSMFITENSIESLGTDLSLQSLRQGGLAVMGGLVYIDTNGNVTTQGDLTVRGKLAVNVISPLPDSDLTINNASGSGILSINQTGDIVASGSGTFAKLNFSLVAPVLALSPSEVIASASAGVANIAPYYDEVTVRNKLVTDKSVIYITPVGTPSAQSPFLIRQTSSQPDPSSAEGSFTVGVQSPTNRPIPFNWLIVN